jgi:antitoxin component of MazEF toxin-antitoxin module
MRFRTTVELGGKTATGMRVPPEVVEGLGAGKKPAVRVTIGSHTYRSTIASRGGVFLLPISAENRGEAGVAAGDEVEVAVELDTEPREVAVPDDLAAALADDDAARTEFERLPYSHQLRHVLAIEGAKAADTRQRRVTKAVEMLREGRR